MPLRITRLLVLTCAAAAMHGSACSPNDPQDAPCNMDSDCQAGLACVAPALVPASDAGACTLLDRRCTHTCKSDSDCAMTNFGRCALTDCTSAQRYCVGTL